MWFWLGFYDKFLLALKHQINKLFRIDFIFHVNKCKKSMLKCGREFIFLPFPFKLDE